MQMVSPTLTSPPQKKKVRGRERKEVKKEEVVEEAVEEANDEVWNKKGLFSSFFVPPSCICSMLCTFFNYLNFELNVIPPTNTSLISHCTYSWVFVGWKLYHLQALHSFFASHTNGFFFVEFNYSLTYVCSSLSVLASTIVTVTFTPMPKKRTSVSFPSICVPFMPVFMSVPILEAGY